MMAGFMGNNKLGKVLEKKFSARRDEMWLGLVNQFFQQQRMFRHIDR